MKLLVIHLDAPDNSLYINPEKVGSYMLGRQITRYPLFAVAEDKTMTPIEVTSGDISILQKEVDYQLEVLTLREQVKELTEKLRVAEALLPQQIPADAYK